MEITKTKQENYRQVALDRLARVGIDEVLAKTGDQMQVSNSESLSFVLSVANIN